MVFVLFIPLFFWRLRVFQILLSSLFSSGSFFLTLFLLQSFSLFFRHIFLIFPEIRMVRCSFNFFQLILHIHCDNFHIRQVFYVSQKMQIIITNFDGPLFVLDPLLIIFGPNFVVLQDVHDTLDSSLRASEFAI